MQAEISGSIEVREHYAFRKDKKYRLLFTRDRILGVKTDGEQNALSAYLDSETGSVNRSDILSADADNFDIPYIQVRQVRIKKGGFSLSGKTGDLVLDTYEGAREFVIESGEDYRSCARLLSSLFEHKFSDLSPQAAVKYCPECGEEYQPWVTACPDCGVALTDEPPEFEEEEEPVFADAEELHAIPGIKGDPKGTMVSIARAPNSTVAYLWKGLLDEQEIPCMIGSPWGNSFSRVLGAARAEEGIDILVRVRDGKRAYEILEPFLDV